MTTRRLLPDLVLALTLAGCEADTAPVPPVNPAEPTPDRLQPGEELPGVETAFGIEVPRGMQLTARFPDVVQLRGRVPLGDLVKYYRKRVLVTAIELGANQAVFPAVYVNGDASRRVYRIVITDHGARRTIRMTDETKPPAVQGLSETERWQRAGLQPNGDQLDRSQVY